MKTTNPVDPARVELLLADLRLPAIKLMWAKLAQQSDKEGWPAAHAPAPALYTRPLNYARGRMLRPLVGLPRAERGRSDAAMSRFSPRSSAAACIHALAISMKCRWSSSESVSSAHRKHSLANS